MALTFDSPDADIALVSSDETTFAVHKCILSLASPFFRDMFSLPQPPSDASITSPRESLPCTEPAAILRPLLQFIYPVPNPSITSLDELVPLLEASQKYQIDYLYDELRKILIKDEFVHSAPLRVYAIATRFELEEELYVAAKGTLRVNVLDCPLNDDLKYISAYDYHRLLDLHQRHSKAMQMYLDSAAAGMGRCGTCNGPIAQYRAIA